MSQQIAHFKVAAGLKWSRGVEGEGLRKNLLKACQHYTMRVCVHVCACLVESYCALCECACRALSQVGGGGKKAAEREEGWGRLFVNVPMASSQFATRRGTSALGKDSCSLTLMVFK